MKKIILCAFTTSFLLLAGCKSGDGGDPKIVLTKFLRLYQLRILMKQKNMLPKTVKG